jgi:hypothetical protein
MADRRRKPRAGALDDGSRTDLIRTGEHRPPIDDASHGVADDLGSFALCGEVDGVLVVARWTAERGLECPPVLLERARVVVAMGETFTPDSRGGPARPASLDGSRTALLLTLMRACSNILSVEVGDDDALP